MSRRPRSTIWNTIRAETVPRAENTPDQGRRLTYLLFEKEQRQAEDELYLKRSIPMERQVSVLSS